MGDRPRFFIFIKIKRAYNQLRLFLEFVMPTISMFYGILVLMFFRDNRRHHMPHIHVRYQGEEAAVSIDDGSVFDGTIPKKQLKMVQVWI